VDVGANIGLVSLLVADTIQHAILFEPNPILVERAKENLRLNRLSFQIVNCALSDCTGTVEFENSTNFACNRTVDGFRPSVPTIMVQRTTFDEFLMKNPVTHPITAVKIDVEGHENSVLRGMKEFLKHRRPKLIMFEYLQQTNIVDTLSLFRDVGYSVFELSPIGPRAATESVTPLQDLFACPTELAEGFGIEWAG